MVGWVPGCAAIFDQGSGAGTITVSGTMVASQICFATSGYTISSGDLLGCRLHRPEFRRHGLDYV